MNENIAEPMNLIKNKNGLMDLHEENSTPIPDNLNTPD